MTTKRMNRILALFCTFAIAIMMVLPVTAKAQEIKLFSELGVSDEERHVFDGAGFYSEKEIEELEERCEEISKEFNTDVIIATIKGYSGNIDKADMEIETARYGGINRKCANMLIVDILSRDIRVKSIEGSKNNDNWMESPLCDYIYEKIKSSFSSSNYYDGTQEYLDLLEKYLPKDKGFNPNNILYNPLFHLGAAIIISAIIVATQVAGAGGKVTVSEKDYLLGAEAKVDRRDIFLRKTVTKTKIESSSGGGGGRSGGGGGGRGGGGGKF
ncbi:MAG: TPM domain-containing protein [Lachnospiraceae bacterium]|nr:TPM domain-containing protein [Lachnospiraceae bacterium]